MINSLKRVDKDFKLYVLCMDEKCYEVLNAYYPNEIQLINLSSVLHAYPSLKDCRENRSRAEFCWSCTALLIKYVLTVKEENCCTYVDSDLYFYSSPICLKDEMVGEKCSVQTLSHNFPVNRKLTKLVQTVGSNCVEFNTFTNDKNSMDLLDKWIQQCLNKCSLSDGGDQKYTDEWGKLPFVNISKNLGAGVAPWNISRFKGMKNNEIFDCYTKQKYELVFYHFQNVVNKKRHLVSIEPLYNYAMIDIKLVKRLYYPYIRELEMTKRELEKRFCILPLVERYTSVDNAKKRSLRKKIVSFLGLSFSSKITFIKNQMLRILRKKIADVNTLY